MNKIVISGYYGANNAGDEAMIDAMLEAFTQLGESVECVVISSNPANTMRKHNVRAISRFDIKAIVKAFWQADLLVSGGGSLLQNVTSGRSLYYYLGILFLANICHLPVMIYAQGIGPVHGWLPRKLMKWFGNRTRLITVRDKGSLSELQRMEVNKPPIYVTADPVLAINQASLERGREILRQAGADLEKPLVGIYAREWCNWEKYKQILAQVADKIATELQVQIVFVPMQVPEDYLAAEKIATYMHTKPILLDRENSTAELLSITGNLEMLIAIRLHALIFAVVMGIPMIGVSYDPKVDSFLESIGEDTAGNLCDLDVERVYEHFWREWQKREVFLDKNKTRLQRLRDLAMENARLALKIMHKEKLRN